MPDMKTLAGMRDFLRLCLAPPRGEPRTPEHLAAVLPDGIRDQLHAHVPHLGALHTAAETARTAYVDALTAWIDDTAPGPVPAGQGPDALTLLTALLMDADRPATEAEARVVAAHVLWIHRCQVEAGAPDALTAAHASPLNTADALAEQSRTRA